MIYLIVCYVTQQTLLRLLAFTFVCLGINGLFFFFLAHYIYCKTQIKKCAKYKNTLEQLVKASRSECTL